MGVHHEHQSQHMMPSGSSSLHCKRFDGFCEEIVRFMMNLLSLVCVWRGVLRALSFRISWGSVFFVVV